MYVPILSTRFWKINLKNIRHTVDDGFFQLLVFSNVDVEEIALEVLRKNLDVVLSLLVSLQFVVVDTGNGDTCKIQINTNILYSPNINTV